MYIDRAAVKARARELLREGSPSPILVGLVYLLICLVVGGLSTAIYLSKVDPQSAALYYQYIAGGHYDHALRLLDSLQPGTAGSLVNTLLGWMEGVLQAGFLLFLLNTARGLKAGYGNLLDGFGMFLRILWLNILQSLLIYCWTLLFIIPGIVARYRYRMAIYILLDNPGLSAFECLRASAEMTQGHKGELFVLDLSFLGWLLLSVVPLTLVWTVPYLHMSYTLYYEALRAALPAAGDRRDSRFDTENK